MGWLTGAGAPKPAGPPPGGHMSPEDCNKLWALANSLKGSSAQGKVLSQALRECPKAKK